MFCLILGLIGYLGSILESEKLRAYPSPYPTLTLPCYQLTVVGLKDG